MITFADQQRMRLKKLNKVLEGRFGMSSTMELLREILIQDQFDIYFLSEETISESLDLLDGNDELMFTLVYQMWEKDYQSTIPNEPVLNVFLKNNKKPSSVSTLMKYKPNEWEELFISLSSNSSELPMSQLDSFSDENEDVSEDLVEEKPTLTMIKNGKKMSMNEYKLRTSMAELFGANHNVVQLERLTEILVNNSNRFHINYASRDTIMKDVSMLDDNEDLMFEMVHSAWLLYRKSFPKEPTLQEFQVCGSKPLTLSSIVNKKERGMKRILSALCGSNEKKDSIHHNDSNHAPKSVINEQECPSEPETFTTPSSGDEQDETQTLPELCKEEKNDNVYNVVEVREKEAVGETWVEFIEAVKNNTNTHEEKKKLQEYSSLEILSFILISIQDLKASNERLISSFHDLSEIVKSLSTNVENLNGNVCGIKRNIEVLYGLNLCQYLQLEFKNQKINSPYYLTDLIGWEVLRPTWQKDLETLVNSNMIESKNAFHLSLNTDKVELNFLLENHSDSKDHGFIILEATMSSFYGNKKLLTKLIQLERQVLAFNHKRMGKLFEIGIVAPTKLEYQRILDIVINCEKENGFSLVYVKDYLTREKFRTIVYGNKPSII